LINEETSYITIFNDHYLQANGEPRLNPNYDELLINTLMTSHQSLGP